MEIVGKTLLSQVCRLSTQRSIGVFSSLVPNARFSRLTSVLEPNRRTELDYEELMNLMTFNEDVALIDVRSPHELSTYGSIPGAINIPLGEVKAAFQLSDRDFRDTFFQPKPPKNAMNLIFFARGPNASSAALEIAHKLGYKKSRQYTGGWEDYCKQTGVPLRKFTSTRHDEAKTTPFMGRASFDTYKIFTH